jgi:hypothetical protein
MAMFRSINRLVQPDGAAAGEGPSRIAILSGAGMTLFVLSA